MFRIIITIFLALFFTNDLMAEDIEVDSPDRARELSGEFNVVIKDDSSKYSQCSLVIIDFPSIRSEMGIQSVQLLTYEPNGKISTQVRVHSSPPPRIAPAPGQKLPELTKDSSDRAYFCIPKEHIKKSQLVITYGYPNAMCYRDRVALHLDVFKVESKLK